MLQMLFVVVVPSWITAFTVRVATSRLWPGAAMAVAMSDVTIWPIASVPAGSLVLNVKPDGGVPTLPGASESLTAMLSSATVPVLSSTTRYSTVPPSSTLGSCSTPLPTSCHVLPPSTETCLSIVTEPLTPV